jgi:MFS family permease
MVIVGIANVTRFSTILALPMEIMSREEVGIASGLVFAIGYSGGIIGPLIGGRILDLTGNLGQSLIMLIGVSIAAAVLASRLPETGPKGNSKREQSLSTG